MDKYLLIKNIFTKNENKEKAKSMDKYMKNKFVFLWIECSRKKKIISAIFKRRKEK